MPHSNFALIDTAPKNCHTPSPEVINPDPEQKLGLVQCCQAGGTCTRHDPSWSDSNNHCMSHYNEDPRFTLQEAIDKCAALGASWFLCTREQVENSNCQGKGCNGDCGIGWVQDVTEGKHKLCFLGGGHRIF